MPSIDFSENIIQSSIWPTNRKNSEFTKLEAWFYLMLYIELEGGNFSIQILSLAKAWSWSRTKVRNFLEVLDQENLINVIKNQDIYLISKAKTYVKKDIEKDTKKNTEKDTEKNTKKDTIEFEYYNTYRNLKDTKKDTEKNTKKNIKKDTEKDTGIVRKDITDEIKIDIGNIKEILKM